MDARRIFTALGALFLALAMAACSSIPTPQERDALAQDIAARGNLQRHDIDTSVYPLAAWQRLTAPGKPLRVYIEGDGFAWRTRHDPSPDPTPTDPVALRLAAADDAPNVAYLARPCQYRRGGECSVADWTDERFAPRIIDSYNQALDALAASAHSSGFELVGFSGGANVAGLLAARRRDVLNLRSVAGDIDNRAFLDLHRLSAMPRSLDMADEAQKLAALPQIHFTGAKDRIVQRAVADSFRAKAGDDNCIAVREVAGAEHEKGWVAQWPELLRAAPACKTRGENGR
ncbi:MAG: alpha/beta hydrolase [Alphaproteobacteria bacterium]|nr:alpha/beta hydrolase [Alphaproteobacteria bacterium]